MNIEQYLLTVAAEECSEIAQACSKAIRFGLHDQYPGRQTTPRADIIREYNDLVATIELMQVNDLLPIAPLLDTALIEAKKQKISRMMLYSADRGRVVPAAPAILPEYAEIYCHHPGCNRMAICSIGDHFVCVDHFPKSQI